MAMVEPEHEELLTGEVGVLATNGPDGRPQVSPVWFVIEDDRVKISVRGGRQKLRNLRADPSCTFLAFHPESLDYYVEMRGSATVDPDPGYAFADRLKPRPATTMASDRPTQPEAMRSGLAEVEAIGSGGRSPLPQPRQRRTLSPPAGW